MREASLPPNLGGLLQSELKAGETILWTGQPSPPRMARLVRAEFWKGFGLTLWGLLWGVIAWLLPFFVHDEGPVPHRPHLPIDTVFAVAWAVGAPVAWLIVMAGGVRMTLAPKRQREGAANTVYVLTNERALILQGHGRTGNITAQSLPQQTLEYRIVTEEEDGSGDLTFPDAGTFSPESKFSMLFVARGSTPTRLPVGIYGILDVKSVDELIQHTLDDKRNKLGEKGLSSA